ncbi:MAG TPA: hypothetical protein VG713_02500, partial [Pirellulales bacterium]|nr:hypothetical protein [Pirellulales bacterium]
MPEHVMISLNVLSIATSHDEPSRGTVHRSSKYSQVKKKRMSLRFSGFAAAALAFAVTLLCGRCWAVFDQLGPSADEWKLKYDVKVNATDGDM